MADHVPGTSPLSHALQSLSVQRPRPAPKVDPKDAFDSLSRQTNVPVNVLIALDEAEGGAADLDKARRNAAFLGEKLAAGARIEDAVGELAGDADLAAGLMDRSYDIADALYPAPAPEAPKGPGIGTDLTDFAKAFGGGAINAAGGAVQSLGAFTDDALRRGAREELAASGGDPSQAQGESIVRSGTRGAAEAVRGVGDDVLGAMSQRGRDAMAGFSPAGEIFSPSTWSLGDDPSIRGAVLQTAQGLGSMVPVVAGSALAGPAGGAAMGALQAAGEGAQSGREFVEAAQGREGESGPAAIEAMPGYQALRDQGLSHAEAADELARLTESEAGARQMIPGALGGAATGKILSRAEGVLNAGGRAARTLKKGAAGALEEGIQEAAEGMAAQSGIAAATGADVNTQDDSFANFVLGAMSGGAMGGGAGLVSPGQTDSEQVGDVGGGDAAAGGAAGPLLLPAPQEAMGLPAPSSGGTIFGQSESRQEPGSFERDPSNPRRPRADQSGAGARFRPDGPAAPGGPIEAAARSIASAMPAPEPQRAPAFPDQKPGSAIRLGDEATDWIADGVFLGETAEGNAQVRVQGETLELTPQQFDMARDQVTRIEARRQQEAEDARAAQKVADEALKRAAAAMSPQQEDGNHVEPGRADQEAASRPGAAAAAAAGVRVDHGGEGSGEGTAARGTSDPEGASSLQAMDEAGMPAATPQDRDGYDRLGGVDVADDAGQPGTALTQDAAAATPPAADASATTGSDVVDSETPIRAPQTSLSGKSDRQTAADWPWRGKKMNSRTRGKAISDYFSPGNIVASYGGGRDRVISFDPQRGAITVQAVEERDGQWVPIGEPRVHSTLPEDRNLVRGPVQRAAAWRSRAAAPEAEAQPSPIDDAAAQADPEPTEAQKEAGNYRKGHLRWNGLDLSIENARGSERRGTDPNGTEWSVTMPAHYGYFRKSEGADGDHVDFYMGDNPDSAHAYVIDQVDAETGAYDEAKVMLGFDTPAAARATHEAAFSDGKGAARFGGIKKMPVDALKQWLASGATKKPVSERARASADAKAMRDLDSAATARPNRTSAPAADSTPPGDPDTIRDRLAYLERQGKTNGWTGRLSRERADLERELRRLEGPPPSIAHIRRAAAVLRDWNEAAPPKVEGVTLKRDDSAGGWVFPRRHEAAVREALGIVAPDAPMQPENSDSRTDNADSNAANTDSEAGNTDSRGASSATSSRKDRIEDFGEKIGGARKDVWATYADQMRDAAQVDISAEPLSKSWPAPDYAKLIEAGVEPWKVSFIRAARDAIPTKPQKSWRLSGWVEAVTAMRDLSRDVMDGKVDQDNLLEVLHRGTRGQGDILGQMKLYGAVGHDKSLKGLSFGQVSYTMLDSVRYDKPKAFWEVSAKAKATAFSNMPRTIVRAETEVEALEAFRKAHAGLDQTREKATKTRKWLIHSHEGRKYFTVGTKIGSGYIQLRRVDTVQEARRIVAEESEALQEQLDKMRDIPADRRESNAPRVGADHRSGADVTPEQFGESFGFRGVEFGNWVEAGRRQQDLNDAYDALMDLAGILDITPKALSLNGSLGLAFGARGGGGVSRAAAHYEPGRVVINLTKTRGAGSLAHEWFHAVDHYFSRQRTDGRGAGYITDNAAPGHMVDGVRPEVVDAFIAVRHAIGKTDLKTRSANIDKTRSKPYWATGIEMHARAFESYVIAKLGDQSAANDYLANVVDGTIWQAQAEMSGLGDSYPYLTEAEIETVRPAFDALFDTIQSRETDRGVELYQRDVSDTGVRRDRPVVAELTGNELGEWSDMRQLRRKAAAWYRQNLVGKTLTMDSTGWVIQFGRVGGKKLGGRKGDILLRLVPALESIIQKSEVVSTTKGRKPGTERMTFHKVAARIRIDGSLHDVIATLREDGNGKFHYDLSMDQGAEADTSGAAGRVAEARSGPADSLGPGSIGDVDAGNNGDARGGNVGDGAGLQGNGDPAEKAGRGDREGALPPEETRQLRQEPFPALEGDADTINIEVLPPSDNDSAAASVPPGALRDIAATVREIIATHGLDRAVSPRVIRGMMAASGVRVLGSYRAGEIRVSSDAADHGHVVRHEIVHALRDAKLWGRDYGLFTQSEWQALASAARGDVARREAIEAAYPDLSTAAQTEEMVAEMYADWVRDRLAVPPGPLGTRLGAALERIRSFFRAAAAALRGEGFRDAARIMDRIASGEIGRRGEAAPQGDAGAAPGAAHQRDMDGLKDRLSRSKGRALGMIGNLHWKRTPQEVGRLMSSLLTDAMGADARWNILGVVPGHALFTELGKDMPASQEYLRLKHAMDAERNEWQSKVSDKVDKWVKTARRSPKANMALMDLMHDTTMQGLDPSIKDGWKRPMDDQAARMLEGKPSPAQSEWARITLNEAGERRTQWEALRTRFEALPKPFQDLYSEIRDAYAEMADASESALVDNLRDASKIVVQKADREHAKELQRIKDEGLTGKARAQAIEAANQRKLRAHTLAASGSVSKMKQLRQMFESNRLSGPYFPLSRFGNYFVTIRDGDGKVTSFSRFEKEADQKRWMREAQEKGLGRVEHGVLGGDVSLREQVDPRFLADVEDLLMESGASREMMDAVWQRWLETLPDQSMRTNRIHRKGRIGFNSDAIRAFSSAMFHGAHQTARLRFGNQMEEALNVAEEQAKSAPDPNRAGFVVREMKQRHAFTMSPTNNQWVTKATTTAFVWSLAANPAAAAINLTQTTVVGVPLMATRYRKAGVSGVTRELSKASRDFMRGQGKVLKRVKGLPVWGDTWTIENTPGLTQDERNAIKAGYDLGVIDKTQAHDLASVADSGVEYNPTRERVMRALSWGFHHAERFNREVTFMAAYRLARQEGLSHDASVSSAASMTWKTHFDVQNSSRPRAMQGDTAKVLTIFRSFQVNMLWRLFRDTHQAFNGANAETRREARAQLIGVSLSMMAHAGIRGVWGYALITSLLALFFPGDDDDMDAWLQDALLMEGDGMGVAAWNWIMGMALNGAPGHALGIDLTNRIGMPELWVRGDDRDRDGQDLWHFYTDQLLGPAFSILGNFVMGGSMLGDGQYMRAFEKAAPAFLRNPAKAARYAAEGVTTYQGDPLIEDVSPWQILMQAQGFAPAEVAERYKINNRLKNQEREISDRRRGIMKQVGDAVRQGDPIPEKAIEQLREFNREFPEWAITPDAIRQSVRSRQRASARNEFGVGLNPKLNDRLRAAQPPALY